MTAGRGLDDFEEFLRWAEQFDFVIIGGMAVGVYADRFGETCISNDLDALCAKPELRRIEAAAERDDRLTVVKRPQPRAVEVLVLRWREQLEIDVLLGSRGLPDYATAREHAWIVGGVRIADPIHLLENKLQVGRAKDRPHIEILRRVCFLFALAELKRKPGREAFRFLQRWTAVEGFESLVEEQLAEIFGAAAETTPDARRFLASRVVAPKHLSGLCAAATSEQEVSILRRIARAARD